MGRVWIWEGEGNRGGEEAEEGGRLGEGLAPFLWRERVFFFLFWNLRVRAGASGTGDWVRRVDWVHGGPWAGGGSRGFLEGCYDSDVLYSLGVCINLSCFRFANSLW